jgi:hypothetical protein
MLTTIQEHNLQLIKDKNNNYSHYELGYIHFFNYNKCFWHNLENKCSCDKIYFDVDINEVRVRISICKEYYANKVYHILNDNDDEYTGVKRSTYHEYSYLKAKQEVLNEAVAYLFGGYYTEFEYRNNSSEAKLVNATFRIKIAVPFNDKTTNITE